MKIDGLPLDFNTILSDFYKSSSQSRSKAAIATSASIQSAASDLAARAVQARQADSAKLDDSQAHAGSGQLGAEFKDAIAETLRFASAEFGEKSASVITAMLYKNIAGGVSEESFGNGLLESARFIDKELGTAAGDSFLKHLNTVLNPQLNAMFGNGRSEVFIAVNTGGQNYIVPGLSGDKENNAASQYSQSSGSSQLAQDSAKSFRSILEALQLGLEAMREHDIKADKSQLVVRYDRNGQALLTAPSVGFLLDEAI